MQNESSKNTSKNIVYKILIKLQKRWKLLRTPKYHITDNVEEEGEGGGREGGGSGERIRVSNGNVVV